MIYRLSFIVVLVFTLAAALMGQAKPKTARFPAGVPVRDTSVEALGGRVDGRTYRNNRFVFQITFPENWYIAGTDFEKVVKERGYELVAAEARTGADREIDILLTAFRSEGSPGGAILRVTAENLRKNPQIRDAVDYFDAITAAYSSTKLPPDFVYSATKAEKLGSKQFAYLDTSSKAGKKRMYAFVRKGFAIMFTLSYTQEEDLRTLRTILERADLDLK